MRCVKVQSDPDRRYSSTLPPATDAAFELMPVLKSLGAPTRALSPLMATSKPTSSPVRRCAATSISFACSSHSSLTALYTNTYAAPILASDESAPCGLRVPCTKSSSTVNVAAPPPSVSPLESTSSGSRSPSCGKMKVMTVV